MTIHTNKCVYVRVQVTRRGKDDDSHTDKCVYVRVCVCAYVRMCVCAYVRVHVIRRGRDDYSH